MIDSVILKDTKKEEWQTIRQKLFDRIHKGLGNFPKVCPTDYKEICRYEKYGLTHIEISYRACESTYAYALIVLPEDFDSAKKYPAVITIHGTNDKGKYSLADIENRPERSYAIELAKRGFVTVSPDQYGFGTAMEDEDYKKEYESFYDKHPDWTLTGRRLIAHQKLIDTICTFGYIDENAIGTMGNSLGGAAVMYLTAFDERIKAAVMSTGISPNATNIYRGLQRKGSEDVDLLTTNAMRQNGKAPWELNEVLALCAPRAIMCIEPFNDPYNPYTMTTIECVHRAWEVYNLLEEPKNLSLYVHGDGHDTVDTVRDMAYDWFERFLK